MTLAEVKSLFFGHRVDNWVVADNDRHVGEGVTFYTMLKTVQHAEGRTFYGHAKGVKYDPENMAAHRWAEMMYAVLLDDRDAIDAAIETHPVVGCFKQHFNQPHDVRYCDFGPCNWLFSGTFFWFDNVKTFSRPNVFTQLPTYWGVEHWPGQMFHDDEALCLLGDGVGDLLQPGQLSRWEPAFEALVAARRRPKGRFCYFTGSNRSTEGPMISAMIRSARAVGVQEDFHVFTPHDVDGAIHHKISPDRSWHMHMAKIQFLREMSHLDYDYFIWIDTDSYFVRDPGDFLDLLRDEPCWVSMESDFSSPGIGHKEWYGLFLKALPTKPHPHDIMSPNIFQIYEQFGTTGCYNTNGGLFIVRKEAIQDFHANCFNVFDTLHRMGFRNIPDEPPLAIAGNIMVKDPEKNRFEHHKHAWVSDWDGIWSNRLPDGKPWRMRDWLTGADLGMINPAIVHMMRGKQLLAGPGFEWQAPPNLQQQRQRLSAVQRIASATNVVSQTLLNGGHLASQEIIDQRLAICRDCSHHVDQKCDICGCQATQQQVWMNKIAHAASGCPDNPPKWGAVNA